MVNAPVVNIVMHFECCMSLLPSSILVAIFLVTGRLTPSFLAHSLGWAVLFKLFTANPSSQPSLKLGSMPCHKDNSADLTCILPTTTAVQSALHTEPDTCVTSSTASTQAPAIFWDVQH